MYNANRFYEEKYVGAPYNFVPFNDKLIPYSDEELPKQNDVSEDLYEGEIEYTVSAITPVFVGSGISDGEAESFYTDAYGRYAIPGSSMRGLIRTNAQILSLSGFMDDIDDYSLMFRAVANGPKKEKERYAALPEDVKTVISAASDKMRLTEGK